MDACPEERRGIYCAKQSMVFRKTSSQGIPRVSMSTRGRSNNRVSQSCGTMPVTGRQTTH